MTKMENESFFSSFKVLLSEGYLKIAAILLQKECSRSFRKNSKVEGRGEVPATKLC